MQWGMTMEYIVGVALAFGVFVFARAVGFDRDRVFYPVMLVVVASYYDLFAAMGGSREALAAEVLVTLLFVTAAVIGFKTNLWIVVAALVGHGVLDFFHGDVIANPGVPEWWPMFCLTYDVAAGALLAALLRRGVTSGVLARAGRGEASMSASCERAVPLGFRRRIRPHVDAELAASAAAWAESAAGAFRHLERAHVLGQASTLEHVRVHARMLSWALRQRDAREVVSQIFRIIGAAVLTGVKAVPEGNTGGANVSAFRPMPIPRDLAAIIASASSIA